MSSFPYLTTWNERNYFESMSEIFYDSENHFRWKWFFLKFIQYEKSSSRRNKFLRTITSLGDDMWWWDGMMVTAGITWARVTSASTSQISSLNECGRVLSARFISRNLSSFLDRLLFHMSRAMTNTVSEINTPLAPPIRYTYSFSPLSETEKIWYNFFRSYSILNRICY